MTNPTFTTAAGSLVHYLPSQIFAVTGPGTNEGTDCTRVHGLNRGFFTINSAPATLVSSLSNASSFASFTTETGQDIWIRGDLVTSIRALSTLEALHNAASNAAIAINEHQWFITASVATAITAVNTAGGTY